MYSPVLELRELLGKRSAATSEARALLNKAQDEKRKLSRDEEGKYDQLMTTIRSLDLDVQSKKAEIEDLRATAAESTCYDGYPPLDGFRAEPRTRSASDVWIDSNGKEVRALRPDEKISRTIQRTETSEPIAFGALIRAMVLGPKNDLERRALAEGTDSAGGYTVPDITSAQLLDALRAKLVVNRAGARTVPLQSDKTILARIATDPTAGWRAENAAVAESDPTFDSVTFTPKSLAVLVKISRELLEDSVNVSQALEMAFAGALGGEVDRVALIGSGSGSEPRGIFNTSGIGSVSMGTNGAALTNYDKLLDAIQTLLDAKASEPSGAVLAPRTLVAFDKLKDTTNQPLRRPVSIEKLPFMATTSMPVTQTQGTAVNASSIIAGDFRELLLGVRTALRIEILKERYAENLQYAFIAHLRMDVQLAHPASFVKLIGIIP
jgi:HK97 family phage major capsid protein